MNIKISEIRKDVFHFEFATQYELCSTMMRPAEFYESSFDTIRGKYFSHETFMDTYALKNPNNVSFTYFTDWSGFNLPDYSIRNFHKMFTKHTLGDKESQLFEMIKKNIKRWKDKNYKYYIICSVIGDSKTLKHEIAHAYWYLNTDYRKQMCSAILSTIDDISTRKIINSLIDAGYTEDVIADEIHAYFSTSSKNRILSLFDLPQTFKMPIKMKRIFNNIESTYTRNTHK